MFKAECRAAWVMTGSEVTKEKKNKQIRVEWFLKDGKSQ